MNRNKAKLKFNPNNFEIIEEGDYVELQEAYYSSKEAQQRYEELNKK